MSVRVMTAVWAILLPDSEKLVLLALADCANDEGGCWPSMATLAAKCSKSDRTIQGAIKSLVSKGHLSRSETLGKGCSYTVHPRKDCGAAPEATAPPKRLRPSPEAVAGDPRSDFGLTVKEPSLKRKSVAKATSPRAEPFPCPEWADKQVWADFMANRRKKRATNSATAHRGFLADINRLASPEWPPPRLLEYAAAHGWAGIYDPNGRNGSGYPRDDRDPTTGAVTRLLAEFSDNDRAGQVPQAGGADFNERGSAGGMAEGSH